LGGKLFGEVFCRPSTAPVAGVVFAEWPVIGVSGKVSSSNAPAGVGGSKSK